MKEFASDEKGESDFGILILNDSLVPPISPFTFYFLTRYCSDSESAKIEKVETRKEFWCFWVDKKQSMREKYEVSFFFVLCETEEGKNGERLSFKKKIVCKSKWVHEKLIKE